MERRGSFANNRNSSNAEEPETKCPEECACRDGEELQNSSVEREIVAVIEEVELFWEALRHADQCKGCEGRWADADEHSGAVFAAGEARLHQAANVVRVHHEADGEAKTLEGDACCDDGDSRAWRLICGDDGGDCAAKHDGERGEDPGGHHCLQAVGVRGEDEGVLDDCYEQRAGAVDPEEDFEGLCEGGLWFVAEVFVQAADDGCDGEPEGWEEETFSVMAEGFEEVAMDGET